MAFALFLLLAATTEKPEVPVPDSTPVHLAVALRVADTDALDAFRKAQHDPASPDYQRNLTPTEFGRRFGPPPQAYTRVLSWLRKAGFTVTEFPNRIFLEGTGNAANVTKLLGIRLRSFEGEPVSLHAPDGVPHLPAAVAPFIMHISGLDTRVRYRHHAALEH